MLSISGLGKIFSGGVAALENIDLRMARGEFIALLGPSGCGKSTLLRIVAGLIAPTSGRVEWAAALQEGDIGVVFQEPTLMPWANVRKNVETPLRIAGVPATERTARAMEMLALVGLENFALAYPRTLSGGMKMRVAIARALITRPPLLLLDEPFAALDEITRQQLNDDLLDICNKAQLSVLFVTHSAAEAVYLSERILIMSARPGTIRRELRINAPEPRAEAFRHSQQFAAYCGEISAALREAAV
ncbi:MAG: NitT/TauT family transport system ATP-binding protein [Alphaproteobacteria bacterium]|nr:NitT/TauT family transport system ATP-binding protein [Alphaproteobacteria bacterium]